MQAAAEDFLNPSFKQRLVESAGPACAEDRYEDKGDGINRDCLLPIHIHYDLFLIFYIHRSIGTWVKNERASLSLVCS